MVRKLRITDLSAVTRYSAAINDYKVKQIDFNNSVIQINDKTSEIEWFFILSNDHGNKPSFVEEIHDGAFPRELIDIYCKNDAVYSNLQYYFWYICRYLNTFSVWMQNDCDEIMKKYLDRLVSEVEITRKQV